MFKKLFGGSGKSVDKNFCMSDNFDDESNTSAKEDSIAIRKSIPYIIIQSAWYEYTRIKMDDDAYDHEYEMETPVWKALEKIEEYNSNFSEFTEDEKPLLKALKSGFLIYSDVLHILIDHHDDEDAANDLYEKYPALHDAIPAKYDNPKHVIEVLVEYIKDYQWQLEHFLEKHCEAIDFAYGQL